jgi:hypothetical protein
MIRRAGKVALPDRKVTPMNVTATAEQVATVQASAGPKRQSPRLSRLWPQLIATWTRRLDRRIEQDLRWLDHSGLLEDFRSASRD